jgi:hypothetical protein
MGDTESPLRLVKNLGEKRGRHNWRIQLRLIQKLLAPIQSKTHQEMQKAMSQFDDRKAGQEAKFQLDQDLEFKAQARRAKFVGLWAAGLMGLSGEEAEAYAKSVVVADLEEAGTEDLFRKIRSDLDLHAVQLSDHQIRAKMDEALAEARLSVKNG